MGNVVKYFVAKLVREFRLAREIAESLDDFRYVQKRQIPYRNKCFTELPNWGARALKSDGPLIQAQVTRHKRRK